ncbi:hypothetical protein LNKW23_28150 [Paralimibaculum aggregatum]|uniref:Uncharacterized protein n=2 Tax=Paralimibaculum aggregatum TaxID=3036245 RepID=A0ABQ6LPD4_9RHOB|nr:hypothetical protein LNKW23_28150 [Limibaculum sp. NKW23]
MLLSGCLQLERGLSDRDDELERTRVPYRFVETGPQRAIVRAGDALIAIEPVEGLCLTSGTFSASETGVFAVVADCVTETAAAAAPGADRVEVPPAFPGLVTVAISGDPAGGAGTGTAMLQLRNFLTGEKGLALLGRNGSGDTVEIVDVIEADGALFVHVHDTHEGGLALLSPEFWRGFMDIRGKLVLVTVSGFRDRPLDPEEMHAVLRAQVSRIKHDNANPLTVVDTLLAAADPEVGPAGEGPASERAQDAVAPAEIDPVILAAAEEAGAPVSDYGPAGPGAPEQAPAPKRRGPGVASAPPEADAGSPRAPRRSPVAPARPGQG